MGRKLLLFTSNPFNLNESLKENLSSVAAPRIPRVVVVGNSLFSKSISEALSSSVTSAITSGSFQIHLRT